MLKRTRNWILLVFLALVCVLFGWQDLVGFAVKGVVRRELGCRLAYRNLCVRHGRLVIEDPVLFDISSPKSAFHIKADQIDVNWRRKGKKIEAKISFLRPHVLVSEAIAASRLEVRPSRYVHASFEVEEGTFEWKQPERESLVGRFSLKEGLQIELQAGRLAIVSSKEGEVRSLACTLERWPLQFTPLAAGGTVSGSLRLDWEGKKLLRAGGELQADEFSLAGEKWKASAESLCWEGEYEPIEGKAEGWMESHLPQMIAGHNRFSLQSRGVSLCCGGSKLEGLEAEASYTREEGVRWCLKNELFSCEGKGFFQSRFADWAESEFKLGAAKCRIRLSDDGNGSVFLDQADAVLAQLVSDLSLREWPIRWKTGRMSGHAEWDGKGSWKGEVIESSDLCLAGDGWEWSCRSGHGRVSQQEAAHVSLHFEGSRGSIGPVSFEEGRCDVEIHHDIIRTAVAAAQLNGLAMELRAAGTLANAEADASLKGAWADYWTWRCGTSNVPFASQIVASTWHFRKDSGGIDGSVRCSFGDEEEIEAMCALAQNRGEFHLKRGEVRGKGIDLSRFAMFLPDLWGRANGVLTLQGDESGRTWSAKLMRGAWEGLDFTGEGVCDLDGEKNFSFRSTSLAGELAMREWRGQGHGEIQIAGALMRPVSEWKWIAHGRLIRGSADGIENLSGDFVADSESGLVEASHVRGELNFGGIQAPLTVPKLRREKKGWMFDARLEQGLWDAARWVGRIEKRNGGFDVQFDPGKSHCLGIPLQIEECRLGLDSSLQSLHLKTRLGWKNLANALRLWKNVEIPFALKGEGLLEIDFKNHWSVRFCTNGAEIPLIASLRSSDKGWIGEVAQGTSNATCRLFRENDRWRIAEGQARWNNNALKNVRGVFATPDRLELKIETVSCDLKHLPLPFALEGMAEGSAEVTLGWNQNLTYEANFDLETKGVKAGTLSFENQGPMHVQISSKEGVHIRGLDFSIFVSDCKNPQSSSTHLYPEEIHARAQQLDASCRRAPHEPPRANLGANITTDFCNQTLEPKANIRIGQLHCDFPPTRWTLSRAQLKCPVASLSLLRERWSLLLNCFDGSHDIDLSADVECAADFSSVSCGMREGFIPFCGAVRHIQNVNFTCDEHRCNLQMQSLHQGHSLSIDLAADLDETVRGRLILDDEEENLSETDHPLQIDWQFDPTHGFSIESIAGHFGGLDASFHADGAGLIGSAHVHFGLLSEFLPPTLSRVFREMKIGKGYELKGRLSLSPLQFKGLVSGKQCELCGFQIRTLLSQLEIGAKRVRMFDLKASDSAGILKIDDLILSQNEAEPWRIEMPLLRLYEFRPSLLQKAGREAGAVGPLVVRKGELRDFKGLLDDTATYTAKGELTFINSFKREQSVFDLPADFFGRIIGLDAELLIPVQGRIEFDLKEERFWLTELHDAYSEGERSKFFLVQSGLSPSVGLNGDLNILVKMKQYVLFKITEHFLLLIDGTLDKPSYHFQKKSKFLGIGL